jgi:5-methylcytosine-specific restriction endonuclease McrBC GTP-binding regulatory subunit McrB
MSLQLEVGKTYKDRKGNLVTITDKRDYACTYPYTSHGATSTYMPDGRFSEEDMFHDYDLVEEVLTMPMFGSTWAFPNFKQVEEETKMQDQIVTINCTLVVRDIEGTLTLQVHPKDEFWRADDHTTVLDSNFELVLPKAKVEELYTERLLAKVQKADQEYKVALEAFETAKDFLDNL